MEPQPTHLNFERCYRALQARDARFDGWFITGVTSTGIYCRPSCPTPVKPMRKNVQFFPAAAAAQLAGLRACKRCLPDASPGSPAWDLRADLAGRAMRLIADGVVDRSGVAGLAGQLAVSERNLQRILQREVGASPVALARAQRARAARILIETTELPFTTVASAAGFGSIRQFNDTVRAVFAKTPTELRNRRSPRLRASNDVIPGAINVRLAFRAPFKAEPLAAWIASHAPRATTIVASNPPGTPAGWKVTRSLDLPHGHGVVTLHLPESQLSSSANHVHCSLHLEDFADVGAAVSRVRRLLDLDADPHTIVEHLEEGPLAELAHRNIGLRVPGAVDGFEQAVMTILGQQVTVAAARTFGQRLVEACGQPLSERPAEIAEPDAVTHVFPSPERLAETDLRAIGLTTRRQATIAALANAVNDSALDLSPGANREATRAALLELPGIGPWTAEIVAMRALADPDVFPAGDLILQRAAGDLGLPATPAALAEQAADWAPWRSYAAHLLWTHGAAVTTTGKTTNPRKTTTGKTTTRKTEKRRSR